MPAADDKMKKPPKGGTDSGRRVRNVGDVLRQAYNDAVRESIPDDLLDLLKKLD